MTNDLSSDPAVGARTRCTDRFDDDRPAGTVVGSVGPAGAERLGVDAEGRIAIDNGALRLRPLAQPGWGRESIAYGPFDREPGLAFAAHVLNGHNASQTFHLPESRRQRLRRVLSDARRLRFGREEHYENLAVGFLADAATSDPMRGSHSFVMHAATEDNGELWTAVDGRPARIARGVLNVPFVFVVALRPGGAAYYTSSLPGATGAAPHPWLRPVGIDTTVAPGPLVAGLQQRILGEVGYRVDTRVYGVEVAAIEEWASWYGTAHAADTMIGDGRIAGRAAVGMHEWTDAGDGPKLVASATGARSERPEGTSAVRLVTGQPVGLLHAVVETGMGEAVVELRWRVRADGDCLAVVLDRHAARVIARRAGEGDRLLAKDPRCALRPGGHQAVQVLDDGETVAVHVDGSLVGDAWSSIAHATDPDDGAIGLGVNGDAAIRDVEAHPRQIWLPDALDTGSPWQPPPSEPALDERFDAVALDLHGAATPSAGRRWTRDEGEGRIEVNGDGARVRADREQPNPGRTIFTVAWDDPTLADLRLDMTMPGSHRGEGHNGRCGVVFWQDPDNYLVVNVFVDDAFDGASISTFYHLGGTEEMYDAVWTLVGGVEFGRRCTLRATFDGLRFLASVDDEPALVRALTDVYPATPPLRVERVGIIVNREWGDDTGTVLHRFRAGRRSRR